MRRILVIGPFPPRLDAAHGGSRAVAQLTLGLAERHSVRLLVLRREGEPATDPRLVDACDGVEEFRLPRLPGRGLEVWRRRVRLAAGVLACRPMWAVDLSSQAFSRRLQQVAADWAPEIVQMELTVTGVYLPALGWCPAPRVLTVHEPAASPLDRFRVQRGLARATNALDGFVWERFERSVLRSVASVVVLTPEDAARVAKLGAGTPVNCVPLAPEAPTNAANPAGRDPDRIVFVGNFAHAPNRDAAQRLVRDIFPLVRRRCPDARLRIVGPEPSTRLTTGACPGVELTGYVEDIAAELDQAAVVVAPMRLGGGMRVKVLEAVAAGKAVVASPRAVAGFGDPADLPLVCAETDVEFAERIAELLVDPARRTRLAQQARAWASGRPGRARRTAAYEAIYDRLLCVT